MSADPKDVMRRFYGELLTEGKLEVLDEIVSDDYVEHQQIPGRPSGKDAARAFVTMFRAAFPDLEVDAQAMVAEGDEVWAYARMTGTHTGEFMGIAPTGTSISYRMMDRVKVRDGMAVEHWGCSDDLGLMTQLGAVPKMG
ncbi:MAG TPA: ester cyclase [Acidimicrobiia bacterium]